MGSLNGSDEIENIIKLLGEIKDNYYEILSMLDEMGADNIDVVFDDDYKRVIDAIRGVQEYKLLD